MTDEQIRRQAIQVIESLFPPPPDTSSDPAFGRELLEQARAECNDWRNEPTPVLLRLAQLNQDHENHQIRESERRNRGY